MRALFKIIPIKTIPVILCSLFVFPLFAQQIGSNSIFLEPPRNLVSSDVRFPEVISFDNEIYIFYQRVVSAHGAQEQSVLYRTSSDGDEWSDEQAIIENIPLASEIVPPIFSVAHNAQELSVAVSVSDEFSEIFTYARGSERWFRDIIDSNGAELISPQIFAASGGIMFFASQRTIGAGGGSGAGGAEYKSIIYAFRPTAGSFSAPRILPVPDDQELVSNPYLFEYRNRMYLAYENRIFDPGFGISNQIYMTTSADMGNNWSAPVLATDFIDVSDRSDENISQVSYINQNPRLYEDSDGTLLLLIDRNRQGQNTRVSLSRLDDSGRVRRYQNRENQYISDNTRSSSAGGFFIYGGRKYILYYFDTIGASTIRIASEENGNWVPAQISSGSGIQFLPRVVNHRGQLHFFWLRRPGFTGQTSSLIYRQPDQVVAVPRVIPLNYTSGEITNNREVVYSLQLPSDPSGLESLHYSWTQNESPPGSDFVNVGLVNRLSLLADRDGAWNLFLYVKDKAGNRSQNVHSIYDIDITPPAPVSFEPILTDNEGYVPSNTVSLKWFQNTEDSISGYRVALEYLGPAEGIAAEGSVAEESADGEEQTELYRQGISEGIFPNSSSVQTANVFSLKNADNGLWALVVRAIDEAGNVGAGSVEFLRLNKYIPVTRLDIVNIRENLLGNYELSFIGRGYTTDGIVSSIVFDRDALAPWDYEFFITNDDYTINSDRLISNIVLSEVPTGEYIVGLNHSDRGTYFYPEPLSFETNGAVKLGAYDLYLPESSFSLIESIRMIPVRNVIVFIVVFLLILIILVSMFRIWSILKDSRELGAEIEALTEGQVSPAARHMQERITAMQKRGLGLRIKFIIFILILVTAVVAVVSIPLSNFILSNQRQTLVQGLEDRIQIMLESLATGAAGELNSNNVINIIRGLAQLNNQVSAMEEIEFITVSSRPNPNIPGLDQESREYIWSTNDPLLLADEQEREVYLAAINEADRELEYFQRRSTKPDDIIFSAGNYRIEDDVSGGIINEFIPMFNANREDPAVIQLVTNLNRIIEQRAGSDLQESLNQENELRGRLSEEISRYVAIHSEPEFSVEHYDINAHYYTFFYPIYWFNDNFTADYQGTIRLGISTEIITRQIRDTQRAILFQILLFTLFAILTGVAGAFLLASITVRPINKLVKGVERIRDTETKSDLRDDPITVNTGDELNFLADTINQMTDGLITAEVANKSLMLGKDVQKMFIALDPSPFDEKVKATTCHRVEKFIEFFGYYEGAKGVSGDYFYYEKIDGHTYAMIECDVSGKDIEAALIMVTVATLFLQHFNGWQEKQLRRKRIAHLTKQTQPETVLSGLAATINEIIYAREFKGKFAAFTMLTLNEETGDVTFCNAGNNVVNIYRRKEKKVITLELSNTPAAGAVSERIVGMPINFPEEHYQLERGDILLLFTDGFEESRRYLRHEDWSVYQESEYEGEEGKKGMNELEKNMAPYLLGQDEGGLGEAFSINRIHNIIESAISCRPYHLTKFNNPAGNEQFTFDFSTMPPDLPNIILALLSIEKIFRLVPLPTLTNENKISIDKNIDDFLKKYFVQYETYFHHPLSEDENSLYRRYSYISEDSQYDDLTILAVQKK